MSPLTVAYYCSGHGYGHATRVSAFATHLRRQQNAPNIFIVSSAPKHVFAQCIEAGALYRHADIDPVIAQPVAYHVDRRKSVDVLKAFIALEDVKIVEEVAWLRSNGVDCVLSDAAYLPCKAAYEARIPSVLVTNFTFDSVYSYLSVELSASASSEPVHPIKASKDILLLDDYPIHPDELKPLVDRIHSGYRCARLLLLLPGNIPIPSFGLSPSLPSYTWTDGSTFLPEVKDALSLDQLCQPLHPSLHSGIERKVIECPLIVRHPSPDIYTPSGKTRLLSFLGVPSRLIQSSDTKILIVSFGGQIFRKPTSRAPSRVQSREGSPRSASACHTPTTIKSPPLSPTRVVSTDSLRGLRSSLRAFASQRSPVYQQPQALASFSHLYLPGAPPANRSRTVPDIPSSETLRPDVFQEIAQDTLDGSQTVDTSIILTPPTPHISYIADLVTRSHSESTAASDPETDVETIIDSDEDDEPILLPDSSWIAIVCGATGSTKQGNGCDDGEDDLPENFFVAPKDVYMPDLTAIADVLLGKLGYGTVSECVDACTPFVYVPRPLFIEEHGLRRLLNKSGVGVQLSREQYEAGDWARSVDEAWMKGQAAKARKCAEGETGERRREGEKMAAELLETIGRWKAEAKVPAAV